MTNELVFNRQEIEEVCIGCLVPTRFGGEAEVVRISYRGVDINGKAYVGYYHAFGDNASMSDSLKEGEVFKTIDGRPHTWRDWGHFGPYPGESAPDADELHRWK